MAWTSPNYRNALKLQKLLMTDAENPETPAAVRAQVARAWEVLEERKRIIRMKPKPRDLDTTAQPKRTKQPAILTFTEPEQGVSLTGQG